MVHTSSILILAAIMLGATSCIAAPIQQSAGVWERTPSLTESSFDRRAVVYDREAEMPEDLFGREFGYLEARAPPKSKTPPPRAKTPPPRPKTPQSSNAKAFNGMLNQYNQLQQQTMLENMQMQKAQAFWNPLQSMSKKDATS